MFDRFTDNARQALGQARETALELQHDYIGTEHFLIGLVNCSDNVAGISGIQEVLSQVQSSLVTGPSPCTLGQLPFTEPAKKVLEHSLESASTSGNNFIGCLHILVGVLRAGDAPMQSAFEAEGITVAKLAELIQQTY